MDNEISVNEVEPFDAEDCADAVEAVLFAAGYPMKRSILAHALSLSEDELIESLAVLCARYEDRRGGIRLLLLGDELQLYSDEKYREQVKIALGIKKGGNLSRSSLEVLAVIAYNQPVTKSFIEGVRGVDSTYTVSSLTEKGLIEQCGQLDAPGRPMLYRTTGDFLRVFGLSSVHDLPPFELLGENGQVIIKP